MCFTVTAYKTCPVHHEFYGQVLYTDIMKYLVICSLQK